MITDIFLGFNAL